MAQVKDFEDIVVREKLTRILGKNSFVFDFEFESKQDLLWKAFVWDDTEEGQEYWHSVEKQVLEGIIK